MSQHRKVYVLTFTFLTLAATVPEASQARTDIISESRSAREYLKRAGRDTTANEVLDSILAGPKVRWRRPDLNPRLRHRIHLNAADVPGFPRDDPKLMDPRNWPATMNVEGELCSLTVYVMDGYQSIRSRSIEGSGAPIVLQLYYTDIDTDFHSPNVRNRGPSYDWLNGRLRSRSYTQGRGSHSRIRNYMPYPSGELFTFMEFDKRFNAKGDLVSMERIEETFARDGTLIGCCASGDNGACGGYWLGVDVGTVYVRRWAEALERSLERH